MLHRIAAPINVKRAPVRGR